MIDLPTYPGPASADAALIDYGGFLVPGLGGPVQRIDRLGNRFRLSVSLPPMTGVQAGRQWVARLLRAKTEGGRMAFPLQGFLPGVAGPVAVVGSTNAGKVLAVRGATPNYIFREGQFFSMLSSGKHHLHFVDAEVIASATGTATLQITPMIRRQAVDGDLCFFEQPIIEGYVVGEEQQWSMQVGYLIGINFELRESE